MTSDYDPVYLNREVCRALKAWPEQPEPKIMALLESAAIVRKGGLTNLGAAFIKWVQTRSFSGSETTMTFFRLECVLQCWPLEMLSDRYPAVGAFLALFAIDYNTPDVRRYIAKNLGTKGRQLHGFWENPTDAVAPAGKIAPPLLELMADLAEAMSENAFYREIETHIQLSDGSNFHGK